MKLNIAGAALALLAVAPLAQADFTLTPAVVSDYDFRGISLSTRDPAVQLGADWTNSTNFGFGLWASQTDLGTETDIEVDATLSYNGGSDELFKWSAGLVYYTYVSESSLNYPEAWAGISKQFTEKFSAGAKLWYSNDYGAADESATYIDANARFELPKDFGLELHVGKSDGAYWDAVYGGGYTDFAVGLTYSFKDFNFALRYIDGSDLPDLGDLGLTNAQLRALGLNPDLLSTDSKVVLSVSRAFTFGGK
jgi:uncharacterized protein (TIGR02001 family)